MSETPHQPCPFVDCASSDAFSWNSDGYGKCHSCGSSYPAKGKKVFEWAKERYPVKELKGKERLEFTNVSYENIRGLDADVAKLYGIQRQETEDGEHVQFAFKYPNNVKYRDNAAANEKKKIWFKNKGVSVLDLFGPEFNAGSSKRLYLTEGEFDAASLYQILGKTFPVKSIPSASIGDRFIKYNHKYLDSFEQIVYAGELDDAGQKSAERLYQAYPTKFYFVPMSKWKDANEFLMEGDGDDLKWAALKPQRYSPDNFFCSSSEFLNILREENPYEAISTGHSGLDYMTRGLVRGGVTFIKAPPGTGKSLAPDTPVLMYDGTVRKAIDVQEGDYLMGPDSTGRLVTNVNLQTGPMYRITPVKGESWECNADHILSLQHTTTEEIKNVVLTDYLQWSDWEKSRWKLWRTGVEFKHKGYNNPIVAYCVGAYLGDGREQGPEICMGKKKQAVLNYMLETILEPTRINFKRGAYYVGFSQKSKLWFEVSKALEGGRHIPQHFKISEADTRKHVLAGLLDTDGSLSDGGAEITQKSEMLADDICFVARSLGFAAYKKQKTVRLQSGKEQVYYRVFISGDLSTLPTLRLKFPKRKQVKSVLRTGFKVESIGEGTYRGIALDGDHLFLLGDFTVTHNTEIVRYLERAALQHDDIKIGVIHMEEMKSLTLRAMASYELGCNVRTKEDQTENAISDEQVEEAVLSATKGDRTIIFEMRAADDPMDIVEYCRLAAGVYGADFIFIDHVQRLTYLTGTENAVSVLTQIASQLAQLAKELNIGIISISHVNEDGATKWAKSLEEEAIISLKIDRDKEAEDEYTRNLTKFTIEKNRPFSRLGSAGMVHYDSDTTLLEEVSYDI